MKTWRCYECGDGPCWRNSNARPCRCVLSGDDMVNPDGWKDTPDAEIEGDKDPTNPDYYAREIQHWNACYQQFGVDGCLAHIFGYAWRAGKKPGVPLATDLRKIINWCEFLLSKSQEDSS